MYFASLCVAFVLCLYGVSTDNATDYIHQLELEISDLESHSLASEQKQGAVLASILSKIRSQEQRIQSHEQKIQSQEEKIQSMEQNMRSQDQKIQSHERKIQELKAELENATNTDCSSSGLQPVIFEVKISKNMDATSRIHFDQISTNVGGAYASDTGVFTAPRSGTYQIWFKVNFDLYFSGGIGPVLTVTGGAGPKPYGSYLSPEKQVNTSYYRYKVLQAVLAVSLLQGDPVYLTLSPSTLFPYIKVKPESAFGGVFLGDI